MLLRSFDNLKQRGAPGRAEKCLESVNAIRAQYPYSSRTFTLDRTTNLYLIVQRQVLAGFCEVLLENIDIKSPRPIYLNLRELHIAPPAQGQGAGTQVLRYLLRHQVPIEMVVANANQNMHKLIKRFNHTMKYPGQDVGTIVVSPEGRIPP